MTCESTRLAMQAAAARAWPSSVRAHVAACDACAAVAVELVLQHAPTIAIPSNFAADVARRARLEVSPERTRLSGVTIGLGAAAVLLASTLAWVGVSGESTAILPASTLLLACGEAIALAVWALHGDVVHARARS